MLKSLTWIAISTLFITPIIDNTQDTSEHLCECILDDSAVIHIYNKPNGDIIDSMQNDYFEEEFFAISISEKQKDWYKIDAYSISKSHYGWVKVKGIPLYTFSGKYNDTLDIYTEPKNNSKVRHSIDGNYSYELYVIDCEAGWLLVSFTYEGKPIQGWIKEEDTCPNPYTTCN